MPLSTQARLSAPRVTASVLRRLSTKARSSPPSVTASSLTPASSTDWLSIGMPASTNCAQAARAAGVSSRAWLTCSTPELALPGALRGPTHLARHALRRRDRNARVHADDLDVVDGCECAHDPPQPACR